MIADKPDVLWVMPRCWGLPNASPFVMKLQTWLRMAEVPHETKELTRPPRSPSGKVPYLERPDGTLLCDTARIIALLTDERSVQLDVGRTAEERAKAVLLTRLLEDHLYWVICWSRFGRDEGWVVTREAYFGGLPALLRPVVATMVRRQLRRDLAGQGFGRMGEEAWIWDRGVEDLEALATLLGDGEFFLGDAPRGIDATAFGFLANLRWAPIPSPVRDSLLATANLMRFTDRMRERYWAGDMLMVATAGPQS